uniref:ATP-dependent RNA helicase n=1 Tax=Macrostomum lignano TaxID=282301 RepID=A0A1I8FU66_9PLAT
MKSFNKMKRLRQALQKLQAAKHPATRRFIGKVEGQKFISVEKLHSQALPRRRSPPAARQRPAAAPAGCGCRRPAQSDSTGVAVADTGDFASLDGPERGHPSRPERLWACPVRFLTCCRARPHGLGKTGSGKTLAFLVPAVELMRRLSSMPRNGTGLHYLWRAAGAGEAPQLPHRGCHGRHQSRAEEARNLAKGCPPSSSLRRAVCLDHLQNTEHFLYKNLACLILDEADRILDVGFEEEMKQILRLLPKKRSRCCSRPRSTIGPGPWPRRPCAPSASGLALTTRSYVVLPAERRFSVLYTFLKKNRKRKVMVFMSSCLRSEILLRAAELHSVGHSRQARSRLNGLRHSSSSARRVASCSAARRRPEAWISAVRSPDDPKEYIHRVGRTARAAPPARALLMLRDHELSFLVYLRAAKVRVTEYEFSCRRLATFRRSWKSWFEKNYYLCRSAQEAYKGFVRAYASHALKKCFAVERLDLKAAAKNFGLAVPPLVDLDVRASGKASARRRVHGGATGPGAAI